MFLGLWWRRLFLSRTLDQHACQHCKKEPPDSNAAVQAPSIPLLHIFCNRSTLAVLLEHMFLFGQDIIPVVYLPVPSPCSKVIAAMLWLCQ